MFDLRKLFYSHIFITLTLSIIIILPLFLLGFGNPQWHEYVYIFQCYYWPWKKDRWIEPPERFTGIWKSWYKNDYLLYISPVGQLTCLQLAKKNNI